MNYSKSTNIILNTISFILVISMHSGILINECMLSSNEFSKNITSPGNSPTSGMYNLAEVLCNNNSGGTINICDGVRDQDPVRDCIRTNDSDKDVVGDISANNDEIHEGFLKELDEYFKK